MSEAPRRTGLSTRDAIACGMLLAVHAREAPERPALLSPHGDRSFDSLNRRANRLARALCARGLRAGDGVALVCANRPEFAEALYATQRAGLRLTPINWHLGPEEIAYIVDNCEARAFLADARFAAAAVDAAERTSGCGVRLALAGGIPGFDAYEDALAPEAEHDLEDPQLGGTMLYTSGTTGRPKGVHRRRASLRALGEVGKRVQHRPGEDLNLCTGPLYHAAPLAFSLTVPLAFGVGAVLMDGWDAREALRLVERHRVSHTHMVPTMFHRLLALDDEERGRHDLSSLRVVLHGAAPCPVDVKRALLDWLGPVVFEYYAATEGWGSFVTPEEWLERPGSVGKPDPDQVEIRDDDGKAVAAGSVGTIYLKAPDDDTRFDYFKDDSKTASAYDDDGGYFSLGDVGYLDDEGHLFLCDRSADVIISGGVNIYPAEVDAVLLGHPAVADACCVGVPNEEWGEEVRGVVELRERTPASAALADELVALCRERLAHYKCPRRVDFTPSLPRLDSGKIQRRKVRDPYWEGHAKRI
jgi:long-chain acyl-CoA synthetase